MIISASRRTDIPAFYSEWFFNRLHEDFVMVQNPFNPRQISKIYLNSADIECIVFWTKNAQPMINRINELDALGFNYYFHYTVNSYLNDLEVNVPNLEQSINNLTMLSTLIGSKKVIWRYDPIIITNEYDLNFHCEMFEYLAKKFVDKVNTCVISFLDMYKKCERNLSNFDIKLIDNTQKMQLAEELFKIAQKYNIDLKSCAENLPLNEVGIKSNKCIDDELISDICGEKLLIKKDKNQRTECNCVESVDIGAYNSCLHECRYCYANFSQLRVLNNFKKHDPNSPLLIGTLPENCKITERKIIRYR